MSYGKGVITYQLIKNHNDLNISPTNDNDFFDINDFYSSLKNKIISQEDYESAKEFYEKLRMRNISDLNDIYNFQDTVILCKIFKSRTQMMMEKYGFNPRKRSSASTLSGWLHRKMNKVIMFLPTNTKNVEVFEKSLIRGFSCINTRLPKNKDGTRKTNLKVLYKIRNEKTSVYKDKRIVTKILKMDENNQCDNAVAKPLPRGVIKKQKRENHHFANLIF